MAAQRKLTRLALTDTQGDAAWRVREQVHTQSAERMDLAQSTLEYSASAPAGWQVFVLRGRDAAGALADGSLTYSPNEIQVPHP